MHMCLCACLSGYSSVIMVIYPSIRLLVGWFDCLKRVNQGLRQSRRHWSRVLPIPSSRGSSRSHTGQSWSPKCCGLSCSSWPFRVCEPTRASDADLSLLKTWLGNLCSHRDMGLLHGTHTPGETRTRASSASMPTDKAQETALFCRGGKKDRRRAGRVEHPECLLTTLPSVTAAFSQPACVDPGGSPWCTRTGCG